MSDEPQRVNWSNGQFRQHWKRDLVFSRPTDVTTLCRHVIDRVTADDPAAADRVLRRLEIRWLADTQSVAGGELFGTLYEIQVSMGRWRRHYSEVCPRSSLGYRPPAPAVRTTRNQRQ